MAHLEKMWSKKDKKNRIKFMSHESQNNLLYILGNQVRSVILKDLISANLFAIIIDTTTDISNIAQFSLIVRYVHEGNFKTKAKQIILSVLAPLGTYSYILYSSIIIFLYRQNK